MGKKAEEKKRKPTVGYRHTDKLKLDEDDLNDREKKLLAFARAAKTPWTLEEAGRACYPHLRPVIRAYWCAKNSIRRLIAAGFIPQRIEAGTYPPAPPAKKVGGSKRATKPEPQAEAQRAPQWRNNDRLF